MSQLHQTQVLGLQKSFTTPCGAIMAPFTESFNTTTIPNCWTQSAASGWTSMDIWVSLGIQVVVPVLVL